MVSARRQNPQGAKTKHTEIILLEQLLYYFHEESKTAVAAFRTEEARLMFLANMDTAASEEARGNAKRTLEVLS